MPTLPDAADATDPDDRPRRNLWLGAGIAAFLVLGLFWAAIFTGQFNTRNPDELHDRAWATRAEAACKPVAEAIENLPNAHTVASASERADLLDEGTALLEPLIGSFSPEGLTHADDRTVVSGWLADWETYLQDRRDFAAALRVDPKAAPLLTETHGGWNTEAIDAMARANKILSCRVPRDM